MIFASFHQGKEEVNFALSLFFSSRQYGHIQKSIAPNRLCLSPDITELAARRPLMQ